MTIIIIIGIVIAAFWLLSRNTKMIAIKMEITSMLMKILKEWKKPPENNGGG